eukprot:Nitzschia sp. Nitz4//scaffold150_size53981//3589//4949//NITZ4_006668-RA/size53981-snap-gene-0.59-mRNA-1//-1//CDS//3329537044//2928//frame0
MSFQVDEECSAGGNLALQKEELNIAWSQTNMAIVVVISTLVLYYILFGKRHLRRRRQLAMELKEAKEQLSFLQEKLRQENGQRKDIRIFMDGAFDMMHFGHMNAFRLAKSLGSHLVVGINSDVSITECKGAPLMNDEERVVMVQSCKFVDEVVPDCPYIMNKEYLDWVVDKYNIDYVVHGDDPCIVDGKDVYATAKETGKFRTIPRTEGVSTTDIVGRMLLLTKTHHILADDHRCLGNRSNFLTTNRLLQLFSGTVRSPTKDMRVVYIDGAWDMFHPGHVAMLKAARERGDYLIVGVHGDAVVNKRRGMNLPLLNLHERVLSVLGCRYVDDVLIDAKYQITPDMIASLHITEVIHGTNTDDDDDADQLEVRFKFAKEAGIFTTLRSPSDFRLQNVVDRIHKNQSAFQAKFERKMNAEKEFYKEKYGQ